MPRAQLPSGPERAGTYGEKTIESLHDRGLRAGPTFLLRRSSLEPSEGALLHEPPPLVDQDPEVPVRRPLEPGAPRTREGPLVALCRCAIPARAPKPAHGPRLGLCTGRGRRWGYKSAVDGDMRAGSRQGHADRAMLKHRTARFLTKIMDDNSSGSSAIYHTIERDGRTFNFLKGWEEATVSQITTIFAPAIGMVLTIRPQPSGDYYFAGCAPETNLLGVPPHDMPSGATCECGDTAEEKQQDWLRFWGLVGIPPRDNLVLYNLKGINGRVAQGKQFRGSDSDGLFLIAAGLVHELYHVKYHQKMLHVWEGEAEAHAVQRDFMSKAAPRFRVPREFKEAWRLQSLETQRDQEREWSQRHPSWRPSGRTIIPRA